MRIPDTEHTSQPWRIHELAPDFRLEDVWALPTPGGPDDFPRLLELAAGLDPSTASPWVVRTLFAVRWKLGELFGWDDPDAGVATRVPTLRDRLPADLRAGASGPGFDALPFSPLYVTHNEFAAEVANQTMHGVLHLGWVRDDDCEGGYRGQMAVLVKPNGLFGNVYMLGIKPFRHLLVYPLMMGQIGQAWRPDTTGAKLPDYRDCFVVDTALAQQRTAEEWARAILGDAPLSTRRALRAGWTALGFDLAAPDAEGCLLGWPVLSSSPDAFVVGGRSRLGIRAELVLRRRHGAVTLSTLLHLENAGARAVWTATTPMHRQVAARVLEQGVRRVERAAARTGGPALDTRHELPA